MKSKYTISSYDNYAHSSVSDMVGLFKQVWGEEVAYKNSTWQLYYMKTQQ